MFKKILATSLVLATTSSVALAAHAYKGDYKNEMPCPTYQFAAGPYLGLSVGPRVNIARAPAAYRGFEGILSGGWGWMLDPYWYLAGELFVGDSFKISNYRNGGLGVRTKWNYGFDLIPGYMITSHVLGYLRGGVVRARFSDQGVNRTGWQVGVGGQTNIYGNWDLRLEYVFSRYGSVSGLGKPQTDQFNLGVLYKFL